MPRNDDPRTPAPGSGSPDQDFESPTVARSGSLPGAVRPDDATLDDTGFSGRYRLGELLGAGGMGEVRVCRDVRLGRNIALKAIRRETADADAVARFLREARVQGQLEHPAVVPVYDLGLAPDGEPYFTMKRIRGVTLDAIIEGLRRGEKDAVTKFTRHKLLSAFASVCLAMDFAHARGVVHRDLKPENIMLGDFGEVYLLDWGLAKLLGQADPQAADAAIVVDSSGSAATQAGGLMGTLGYMPPEQLRSPAAVDPRADVYALGAILYKILTLEPLHPTSDVPSLIHSTLRGAAAAERLKAKGPDLPPELSAACARAVADSPADRFSSARELHEAVQRFLEGERDEKVRRELSRGHAAAAEWAAERALTGGPQAAEARKEALRDLGRALALDPSNASAMKTFVRLLAEPPRDLPGSAGEELAARAVTRRSQFARLGAVLYVALLGYVPILWWMGVRNATAFAFLFATVAASALTSAIVSRWFPTTRGLWAGLVVSAVMVAASSLILGPFVVAPSFASVITTVFAFEVPPRQRPLGIAVGLSAFVLPALLEIAGWPSPAYAFGPEGMTVVPRMLELPRTPTLVFLLLSGFTTAGLSAVAIGKLRDALASAEHRLFAQAWQLRQLVPGDARVDAG